MNFAALIQTIQETHTTLQQPAQAIKDLYVFEFLELPNLSAIEEKELETALLDHLQQFMLKLGHGFCFEARQQKILLYKTNSGS